MESEKWFKEHKRTLEVNVSAANRFISHAIPELTNEQRSALKRVPCQFPESPCMPAVTSAPIFPVMPALHVTLVLREISAQAREASTNFKGRQTQKKYLKSRDSAEAFLESMEASPQTESVAAGDSAKKAPTEPLKRKLVDMGRACCTLQMR